MPKEQNKKTSWLHLHSNEMTIKLVVGPDNYHPTHLEVKDVSEMLRLLAIPWPTVYSDTAYTSDLGNRIGAAIYDWNALYAEDEEESAYPKTWKWIGIQVQGQTAQNRRGKPQTLNWYVNLTDRNTLTISLNLAEQHDMVKEALEDVLETAADALGVTLNGE